MLRQYKIDEWAYEKLDEEKNKRSKYLSILCKTVPTQLLWISLIIYIIT